MIPKIIHYIWLGGKPLPKIAKKCIASWKKFCPDYEMKFWNEENLDINKFPFAKKAYECGKYAFVSDVMRTAILYEYGGIYLDIDVELLKPIEEFLYCENFGGFETSNSLAPGLIWGSIKNNTDLKEILDIYDSLEFDESKLKEITICKIYTDYYEKKGLQRKNKTQSIDKNIFYASEYFCPIDVVTNKKVLTSNTHAIHWYNASWYSNKQKVKLIIKKVVNFLTFGLFGKLVFKIHK